MNDSHDWRAVVARWLPALLLGVVAFALVLEITDPVGPGLDPDALQYLGSAESLASHAELRAPTARWWQRDSTAMLSHFPPGFPAAMALPVRLGMEPMQSARLVEALAAFVTVTTLVLLVSDAASTLAGVLLATALFAMSSMHEVHVSVLSEPLFLALTALTLAAMVRRPDRPLLAGLWAALAALTRYAGVALVGAVALWSFGRRGSFAERLRRTVVAVLPAVMLQGIWVLRTRRVATTESIRKFAFYGNLAPSLKQGATTMEMWLIPDPDSWQSALPHRGPLTVAVVALLIVLTLAGARIVRRDASRGERRDAALLLAAGALVVVCYIGVLVVSRLLADPGIPFDERILSPMILLVSALAATGISIWFSETRSDLAKIAVVGGLLGWWAAAASVTRDEARYALEWGSDFAGEQWRKSELMAWARTEGAGHPLFTNWAAVLYFNLHRPSRDVPRLNESKLLSLFADTVRARDGRVIEFTVPGVEYVTVDSLRRVPGLRVVAELKDGVVFAPAAPVARATKPR